MAIANVIEFGGVSSDAYDVVIEGPGEYTAPSRAYESISIPGRNGALVLDKGYYENIEAKFNAVIQAKTQLEFERKVRDFKNAIVSQKDYQRLTEAYHPESYRMAVYKSGFDDEPKFIGKAAVFTLVFECTPQRYLMSGETPMEIENGDTLLNPTKFDAQPLLMVNGDGDMELNGYPIHLDHEEVGYIDIMPSYFGQTGKLYFDGNNNLVNDGDDIVLPGFIMALRISIVSQYVYINLSGPKTWISQTIPNYEADGGEHVTDTIVDVTFEYGEQRFTKGVGSTSYTDEVSFSFQLWPDNPLTPGTARTVTLTCSLNFESDNTNWVSFSFSDFDIDDYTAPVNFNELVETQPITALSTQTMLGTPTYIDCELGEAYKIVDGNMVSLNRYIDLGSDLPVLSPGVNEVVIGQGIQEVDIIPRWWEL